MFVCNRIGSSWSSSGLSLIAICADEATRPSESFATPPYLTAGMVFNAGPRCRKLQLDQVDIRRLIVCFEANAKSIERPIGIQFAKILTQLMNLLVANQIRRLPDIHARSPAFTPGDEAKDVRRGLARVPGAILHREDRILRDVDRQREAIDPQAQRVGLDDAEARLVARRSDALHRRRV